MQIAIIWDISRRFQRLSPCDGQVAHVLRTLPPVAAKVLLPRAAPRLACVKPAASVHPEPGSNSSLYILISLSLNLTPLIPKELTLSIIYLFLGTCLYLSFSIIKELVPACRKGIAKVEVFFNPTKFF